MLLAPELSVRTVRAPERVSDERVYVSAVVCVLAGVTFVPKLRAVLVTVPPPASTAFTLFPLALFTVIVLESVKVEPVLTVSVEVVANVEVYTTVVPVKLVANVSEVPGTIVSAPVRVNVLGPETVLTPEPTFEVVIEANDLATFMTSVALFSIVIVLPAVMALALTEVPVLIVVWAVTADKENKKTAAKSSRDRIPNDTCRYKFPKVVQIKVKPTNLKIK